MKEIKHINDIDVDFVFDWCEQNGQNAWLKAELAKKTLQKTYPRKKVTTEEGKKISVADKSKEPIMKEKAITFIEVRTHFVETFMPEFAPKKKPKTPTMYDRAKML
jgi:hypothetical protein